MAGEAEAEQAEPVAEVRLAVLRAVPVGHLALLLLQAPLRRERLLLR